ncbi:MAG: 23S rRNA (adenine(2503)-C(2))-methyltransferase RlmN [Capsulimonadaceae bacterium]|nr:23S rRNA (adenine(2503)-C(2))-methyltransferase RlmN [Capsulimonadaceae bacterium]
MIELLGRTTEEIKALVAEHAGAPAYRGAQIAEWIYRRILPNLGGGAQATFAAMTDLPLALRNDLTALFSIGSLGEPVTQSDPRDGTIKIAVPLHDGPRVEAVLMPDTQRVSTCLSCQAGCPMACAFCATGTQGLGRNLDAGEIVAQFLALQSQSPRRITHAVYMGMGEPMLNLDNVLRSIHILTGEIGLSMRHITLSTVGVLQGIEKLANEKLQLTLAVSLHAPTDELRRKIVPIHRTYTIDRLLTTCKSYFDKTGRRVTFEYILLRGVNDNPEEARQLAALLKRFPGAVNLIPYNPTSVGQSFQRPETARVQQFRKILEDAGVTVTQRKERGQQIAAACGQLVTEAYRPPAGARKLNVA